MPSFPTVVLFASVIWCNANMNEGGIPYSIANPDPHSRTYSTDFTDEYFEVYGEVQTRYSQVYWTRNPNVPLPPEIVSRFEGKVMAITGYEIDQVFKTPEGDKSVPIYWAYNHHYFAWLLGSDAEMVQLDKPQFIPNPTRWSVKSNPTSHEFPTNIVFKENPGGEFRKSYHGYPNGFAQLIHSPRIFSVEPMQIDTHNRQYNGSGYKPWFIPKSAENNYDPNNGLSPLIECPCPDRINKIVKNQSTILAQGTCQSPINSSEICFQATREITQISSTSTTSNSDLPSGCLLNPSGPGTYDALFNQIDSTQTCGNSESLPVLQGQAQSFVNLTVLIQTNQVTITISGPSGVWFGVGFHAAIMADLPYTIIVNGDGSINERKLARHDPGVLLKPLVELVSSSVVSGIRTVVLTRPLNGPDADYFSFPSSPSTILFINAYGNTPTISFHKQRTSSSIALIPTKVLSCVCAPSPVPFIQYMDRGLQQFSIYCAPQPRGDMLHQKNPACKLESYHGGLQCCHHTWFLTDVEQDYLIPKEVDTYFLKFRYYFQEYTPEKNGVAPSHQHLHHWVFLIDAEVNDYEEVKCSDGTMCEGAITARLQAKDMGLEDIPSNYSKIIPFVIAAHCHAPSCIREELYNADTGELLCRVTAQYGTGDEPFNERGYLALPPCIFGYEPGLRPPVTLYPNTNLLAIKIFNNTYRHVGQMAQWTGLMIYQ